LSGNSHTDYPFNSLQHEKFACKRVEIDKKNTNLLKMKLFEVVNETMNFSLGFEKVTRKTQHVIY
jgi:hypothetical protein